MIKYYRFILGIVFVFWTSIVFATEPLIDQFIYDGQEGVIIPDTCCWMKKPKSEKLSELIIEDLDCSAIGGPVGIFKLEDGKLWLIGLFRCGGELNLNDVYPELPNPALADWLSGTYQAKLDWLCKVEPNRNLYKTELELVVEKGVVISKTVTGNKKSACN